MPPNLYYTIRIFTAFIFGDIPMWNEEIWPINDSDLIRFRRIGF
jgi:hypothetical protein